MSSIRVMVVFVASHLHSVKGDCTSRAGGEDYYLAVMDLLSKACLFLWRPALWGLLVLAFSWIIMHYDSKIPGVYPPSPLTPKKYREASGHTFHLGYAVALLNGFVAFVLSLWQQIFE